MTDKYLVILIGIILPLLGSAFLIYSMIDSAVRLGGKRTNSRKRRIVIYIVYGVFATAVSILQSPLLNLLCLAVLFPIMCHFLLNDKKSFFLYYIGISITVLLLDVLISTVFQLLVYCGLLYFKDNLYFVLLYVPISKVVTYLMLRIYVNWIQLKLNNDISMRHYIVNLIVPIFSVVFIYTLVYFAQIYMDRTGVLLFALNTLFLLGFNIYFPKMIEITQRNNQLQNEIMLYTQQEKMQYQYYREIEEKYTKSRQIIHDIRNHIIAMEQLSEENNNEKALSYAKGIHQMLNDLGQRYYTSNKVLNIILNDKVETMKRLNINPEIRIGDISLEGIEDIDITIIFGNILDNAIEACVETEEKTLKLNIDQVRNFISIKLLNSAHPEAKTKKNHWGIGLKNVKRVLDKYNGDIQRELKDGIYQVSILLPLER